MAFTLISAGSRRWVSAAGTITAEITDADRAVSELRADYERWSRWWLGLGAYVLAVFGLFVTGGMIAAMLKPSIRVQPLDYLIVLGFSALSVVGLILLWGLWRSGRELTTAAAWWLRAPYLVGDRRREPAGWLRARTVNTEPAVFARITTSAMAFLVACGGIALFFRDPTDGMAMAAGLVGLVSAACCLGQMGAVMRLVSGLSEGDPLWVRVRSIGRRS